MKISISFLSFFVAVTTHAFSQTPLAFEPALELSASDILPTASMIGPSHRVRNLVVTDGYMAHFQIDTDFGTIEAIGLPEVKQRIAEAEAIRKLAETRKGDLFAEGMKRSVTAPIDAVRNIVTHPVQSVKQAPKTVGHFFAKVGSSIGRGVSKTIDRVSSDEPTLTANEVGSNIGTVAKNVAGFEMAKLNAARQLGVDPYSDNLKLQEEMDKVTWAFFAGGLPLRIAATVASAGVAVAATNMIGIPEDTYALTANELTRNDENAAADMGLEGENFTNFRMNRMMSVTRRHRLILALKAMPKAKGRADMIVLADACTTPRQIDFLINALTILAERERSGTAHYVSLELKGRLPLATASDGTLQIPAPIDFVTWNEEVALFAGRDDLRSKSKILLHTGKLSIATGSGLKACGWTPVPVSPL